MKNRSGWAALVLLAGAVALEAQERIYRIDLVPSGSVIALGPPVLKGDTYVFPAWPERTTMSLKRMRVKKITELTERYHDTVYQVELVPSGTVISRDNPVLKGNAYVFRTWRDGRVMSLRPADVKKITPLTGEKAFWAEQVAMGSVAIDNPALQGGGDVVVIGTAAPPAGSSQAGPSSLSGAGSGAPGISGPPTGNWLYQGVPGVSDAWAPANATVSAPGDVPRMPAATDGTSAPH